MPKVQAPRVLRYQSLTPGDIVIIPAYSRCPSSTYSALNSRLDPEGRVDYECLRNAHAFEKEDRLGVVVYVPKVVESFLTCYVLVAVFARVEEPGSSTRAPRVDSISSLIAGRVRLTLSTLAPAFDTVKSHRRGC